MHVLLSSDNSDFVEISSVVIFPESPANFPSQRRMCFDIGILDNTFLEDEESFTLFMVSQLPTGVLISPDVTRIRIVDDDGTYTLHPNIVFML